MEIEHIQNFFDLLQKSQVILIVLPKNPSKDAEGSALALSVFLGKSGKEVEIVCDSAPLAPIDFLAGNESIKKSLGRSESFVVSINTTKTKLEELSYHTFDDRVDIHLQAENGTKFVPEDIGFGQQRPVYDLIICVNTPSLDQLGNLYTANAALFLDTPKINIDNHISNENYGTVNIVEITAAATSEIVFELLKKYESGIIDASVATPLLAGIISATNSFQRPNTTHNSFIRASELVGFGADQQEIVKKLFKTKSFSMLKLWGRAMARIKILQIPDSNLPIYFSLVTSQDIERSEASKEDARQAFYELVSNLPEIKALFFAIEFSAGEKAEMYFYLHPNFRISEAVNELAAEQLTESTAYAKTPATIQQVEQYLVSEIESLKGRIGL